MQVGRSFEFGLLISIVIPGFIALIGFREHYVLIQSWNGQSEPTAPTVGGFLFLTIASVFAGMMVSTIRWAVIDSLHHHTGLKQPRWKFNNLESRENAFAFMIDIHYRYYQFYGNSIVAILLLAIGRWSAVGFSWYEFFIRIGVFVLLFAGSRDSLWKYYDRVDALLSS